MATVLEPNASNAKVRRAELSQLRSKYLRRDRILGPAWLIMLRLVSRLAADGSTEVCDLISIRTIPAGTAQRCLDYLSAKGLVDLAPGPGRRFRNVRMNPLAYVELRALLASTGDLDDLERECFAGLPWDRKRRNNGDLS